jgi:hypothetical protein
MHHNIKRSECAVFIFRLDSRLNCSPHSAAAARATYGRVLSNVCALLCLLRTCRGAAVCMAGPTLRWDGGPNSRKPTCEGKEPLWVAQHPALSASRGRGRATAPCSGWKLGRARFQRRHNWGQSMCVFPLSLWKLLPFSTCSVNVGDETVSFPAISCHNALLRVTAQGFRQRI